MDENGQAAVLPPQNLEAEESVLGAMMVSRSAVDLVLDTRLEPDDFYRPRHRTIHRAIRELDNRGEPIDALTVSELLRTEGALDDVGGADTISSLAAATPAPGNAGNYAKIVKQNALMRRLLEAAQKIQIAVNGREQEPRELVEHAERLLFNVAQTEQSSEFSAIADILVHETERLEKLASGESKMTGTPSGFRKLDEMTGGFQPGNLIVLAARPAMGKCLPGSALIHDPRTGARRPMREVVEAVERGEEAWVSSVDPQLRIVPARVGAARRSGVQQVFRLTTRLGRRVEATANHPLLTASGWRQLDELEPGSRIAVPRRLPDPAASEAVPLEDHELVLLAALIADGNLTGRSPRFCFGEGSGVVGTVAAAAQAFGARLSGDLSKTGTATISRGRGTGPNPVKELCQEHGIWGLGSGTKFVPDRVFAQTPDRIARFLSVLFACDGHVHVTERLGQVGYTSISERLTRDVQHLLLRLGIVGCIRTLKRDVYEGTPTVAREVRITDQGSLLRFCKRISPPGKEAAVDRLRSRLSRVPHATNVDTIPPEIWDEILSAKGDRTWSRISLDTSRPPNHNWHVRRRGLSRTLIGELATATASPRLAALSMSDVWWDEVTAIEPLGEEETFDISVPGNASFVADDIVVHNSAMVCNIAENVAWKAKMPVAFFSLEMSETELAHRFIACRARISSDRLRKGQVKNEWNKVLRACNELAEAPLWIDDSSDLSMLDLRAKARRLHSTTGGLGLIIVDYIQLMRPDDPRAGRVEQVGQMSRGLKILARELQVPVIGLSQLSRAPEQRPDKVPILADLRESGSIEQDADIVSFIYRDEYYYKEESERPGEADLVVAKHRNGPIGTVPLAFQDQFPRFLNLAPSGGGDERDHAGEEAA